MTEPDLLAEALGPGPADALRRELANRSQTIARDTTKWTGSGHTGAVLAAVVVTYKQAGHPRPVRCIAKVCPPAMGRPESALHVSALRQQSFQQEFIDNHLLQAPFDPVTCPDGRIVSFQQIAGGNFKTLRTLARLRDAELPGACRTVRVALLEKYTGDAFRIPKLTVPDLLRLELRNGLTDWIVSPDVGWIETDEDGILPNPLALTRDVGLSAADPQTYLAGYSHGDLHADNVLVPTTSDGAPKSGKFWLIDLPAFEPDAPLSRDPATLLVSILAHRAGRLNSADREALLEYLLVPAKRKSAAPTDLVAVTDALRDSGDAPFGRDWKELWEEQLQVSVLAAALLHTTYDSVGPDGRWWCLRLAARLAKTLTIGHPEGEPRRMNPAVFGAGPPAEHRAAPGAAGPKSPTINQKIINQKDAKGHLRAAILDAGPALIVVHGMVGVGKSALVGEVVAELRDAGHRVFEHDAAGVVRPDTMTLIEDVENGAASDDPWRPGELLPARLAAAVDALGTQVTIVIDRAQVLLTREARTVADDDLDDALEVLSNAPKRLARVVLVTRDVPRSARSNTWPDNARLIHVHGLQEPHFSQYLAWLDPAGQTGLTALDDTTRETLRDRLQGNPMYATLAHAIVSWLDGEYGADTLAVAVKKLPRRGVPQFLADEQRRQLSDKTKLVLAALAAFGTPVDAVAVDAVVKDRLAAGNIAETLRKLATQRLVEEADGRYRIPAADPHHLLDAPPVAAQDWQDLLLYAARELGFRHKPRADVHDVDDLDTYFAELDVWLRAGRYGAAYEVLEDIDSLLRRWDQALRLLERRERIRQLLDDPLDRMSNYNALGDLYATRGRFTDAADAFKAALDIATLVGDAANQLRIETNMAAMHWEAGETVHAEKRYRSALDAAELDGDATDQMSALEGLADCHRRWSDYASAIPLAQRALSIAQHVGSDRAVNIALKLARWYAETGDLSGAERHVAAAKEEAAEHVDQALRTACADGRADLLLLADGLEDEALEVAGAAHAAAQRQRSPVIQLQAQTTRCMAYLRLGDLDGADDAIERADRYRREGRSLVVLALRALVAALSGHTAEADRRFERLRCEATGRHRRDPRDVGALQFLGYARCWTALTDNTALSEAADYFRKARWQTEPAAPGVEERLAYLVRRLEECHRRSGRLRPVLDAITG